MGLLTSGSDTLEDKPVPAISDVERANRQRKPKSKSNLISPSHPERERHFTDGLEIKNQLLILSGEQVQTDEWLRKSYKFIVDCK